MGHLLFLLEQVDLGGQGLALLIHHPIVINFSHKTPIVTGELVEGMADCGKSGATADQC